MLTFNKLVTLIHRDKDPIEESWGEFHFPRAPFDECSGWCCAGIGQPPFVKSELTQLFACSCLCLLSHANKWIREPGDTTDTGLDSIEIVSPKKYEPLDQSCQHLAIPCIEIQLVKSNCRRLIINEASESQSVIIGESGQNRRMWGPWRPKSQLQLQ